MWCLLAEGTPAAGAYTPSLLPPLLLSGRSQVQPTLKGGDMAATFLQTDFKASAVGALGDSGGADPRPACSLGAPRPDAERGSLLALQTLTSPLGEWGAGSPLSPHG